MRTLRLAPIFLGVESAMISLICSMLTRVSFLKEELICKQGDVVPELLILESGTVMLTVTPPDEEVSDDEDPSMQDDENGDASDSSSTSDSDAGSGDNASDAGDAKSDDGADDSDADKPSAASKSASKEASSKEASSKEASSKDVSKEAGSKEAGSKEGDKEAVGSLSSLVYHTAERQEMEDEDEEEERRQVAREMATRKEILTLAGTCMGEMVFLF